MNWQYQVGIREDLDIVIPGEVQESRDSNHYGLENHLYVFGDATGEKLPGIREPERREIFVRQIRELIEKESGLESASIVLTDNGYSVFNIPEGACVEDILNF